MSLCKRYFNDFSHFCEAYLDLFGNLFNKALSNFFILLILEVAVQTRKSAAGTDCMRKYAAGHRRRHAL